MSSEKSRFTVTLEPDIADKLETFWHSRKLKNKNAALNELLRMVFADKEALTTDEMKLLQYYRKSPSIAKRMSLRSLQTAVSYSNTHYSYSAADPAQLGLETKPPMARLTNDSITYTEKLDSISEFERELEANGITSPTTGDYASEVERFNAMADSDIASIESTSSKKLG